MSQPEPGEKMTPLPPQFKGERECPVCCANPWPGATQHIDSCPNKPKESK